MLSLSISFLSVFAVYYCHFLCIVSLRWYVFCLVVLIKLSVLAKWLTRKSPLRNPLRGKEIISTKPSLKSVYDFQFSVLFYCLLHCMLTSWGTVYCNRSCLWWRVGGMCLWVCLLVCYHNNSKILCIDLHQTGSVGEGSDHLQLIKFWPSCAPDKGVCGGAKISGSALLQPAHSVCISWVLFSLCDCLVPRPYAIYFILL